jgi:hypothetical protein
MINAHGQFAPNQLFQISGGIWGQNYVGQNKKVK